MLGAFLGFLTLGGIAFAVLQYSQRRSEVDAQVEARRREDRVEPTVDAEAEQKEFVDRASGRNRDALDDVE